MLETAKHKITLRLLVSEMGSDTQIYIAGTSLQDRLQV